MFKVYKYDAKMTYIISCWPILDYINYHTVYRCQRIAYSWRYRANKSRKPGVQEVKMNAEKCLQNICKNCNVCKN